MSEPVRVWDSSAQKTKNIYIKYFTRYDRDRIDTAGRQTKRRDD